MKESPPTKFKSTQKHQAGASKPFSLNPTGTLSRRHFAQFVSAIDTFIRIRLQSSSTTHPRARSPAVESIASGFIPPNPFAVSPNEEERSALDAHARPGLEKRDMVQSMSSGRPAALRSIMSTLEQRRDQMFPKLRPEEIDRLRRFGEIRRYAPGELLFVTGEPSPGMVVLIGGTVAASR